MEHHTTALPAADLLWPSFFDFALPEDVTETDEDMDVVDD